MWAYFFLLVAFYLVKKLSTIILPSMYIILTYVQCLSIVGNRQGWGTERTKGLLRSTEIVNFSLDLFIPSCGEEMPYVIKAVFFTLTPVFYVLVDSLLVDPFLKYVYPHAQKTSARTLLWLIRLKYQFRARSRSRACTHRGAGAGEAPRGFAKGSSNGVAPHQRPGWSGGADGTPLSDQAVEDGLRYELGDGIMDMLSLQTPVEAVDAMQKDAKGWMKHALAWSRDHIHPKMPGDVHGDAAGASGGMGGGKSDDDVELTFGQLMKKHFFEDMRLMYVSTTGALLKSLRCTPVGNRDLRKFWLSDAWFGTSVLSTDPQQRCWEGQHARLAPYFIVMLILYAVGYPVAVGTRHLLFFRPRMSST